MGLPTPVYDEDGITLYQGDCREILPQFGLGSVDLLIADPPYGIKWNGSSYRREKFGVLCGDEDETMAQDIIRAAWRCLRHHRHAYIFGPFDLGWLNAEHSCELIWDKTVGSPGNLSLPWSKQHDYIQFLVRPRTPHKPEKNGNGRLTARLRRGSVLRYPRERSDTAIHPTMKPVPLLRELIESSSRIGETLLDPCVGSGSTLVAARLEGRRAIGIEIDPKYIQVAIDRLRQKTLPLWDMEAV